MNIRCKRNVAIGGKSYEVGDVVDVADEVGIRLVNMGKAEPCEAAAPAVEDRAVGLTTKKAKSLIKRVKGKK